MKKILLTITAGLLLVFGAQEAQAQTPYNSAVGIVFDGYHGSNVGIQYKTALTNTSAAQFQVSFREHWFTVGGDWQYQQSIPDADGLSWYVGAGAQLGFWSHKSHNRTYVSLRPQIGLEYKIPTAPLAVHLDYKPNIGLNHDYGFRGGGFTFGVKYILK